MDFTNLWGGVHMYGVYLIDDESLMLDNIKRTVSWPENGFKIVGSNICPTIAITEILALKPDLVLCDLKMPEMDGITLIKTLRDQGAECEFVMLSAYGEFEASRNFFLLNGFDYLLKPLQPQDAEITLEKLSRRLAQKKGMTPAVSPVVTSTKAFDELVSYISENFDKKHTLKLLAKQFHISSTYICNLFAKHYQSTLTMFLTNLRMKEAAKQIVDTNAALKEIAITCGYSDYFYFCRVFKAYYGISPTAYRMGAQEG